MNTTTIWPDISDDGRLARHVDGGLYKVIGYAKHTDDQEQHVIYVHLWPFTPGETWVRPTAEWLEKFTLVTPEELAGMREQPVEEAQAAITEAKAERRAREAQQRQTRFASAAAQG